MPTMTRATNRSVEIDIGGLGPLISRPGHPEDVVEVAGVAGTKIGSAFIGSCTNGRFEDLEAAARSCEGRKVAPGVVLKIVPTTDRIWRRCLDEGLSDVQGRRGPGEQCRMCGMRRRAGRPERSRRGHGEHGKPELRRQAGEGRGLPGFPGGGGGISRGGAIASLRRSSGGARSLRRRGQSRIRRFPIRQSQSDLEKGPEKPERFRGRVWVCRRDNIDTDMIFHNRYLTITDIAEMGQYTFDNLPGWEDFAAKAKPGDIVVTGKNFGAGSSRQQAVDCFESLGISTVIAESFGAIYERNAINAGFPIVVADLIAQRLDRRRGNSSRPGGPDHRTVVRQGRACSVLRSPDGDLRAGWASGLMGRGPAARWTAGPAFPEPYRTFTVVETVPPFSVA